MEQKGFVSDRCELNRQIRADNDLLHKLQATVAKLEQSTKTAISEMAKTMEMLRQQIFILCYKIGYAQKGQRVLNETLDTQRVFLKRYDTIDGKIKALGKRRKELLAQHDVTPILNIVKRNKLMQQITTVIEDREELKTEKNVMLQELRNKGFDDIKTLRQNIAETEATVVRLAYSERQSSAARDEVISKYQSMSEQTNKLDVALLSSEREIIRITMMEGGIEKLRKIYGEHYDVSIARRAEADLRHLAGEQDVKESPSNEKCAGKEPQAHNDYER